jgi:hypothetical protein
MRSVLISSVVRESRSRTLFYVFLPGEGQSGGDPTLPAFLLIHDYNLMMMMMVMIDKCVRCFQEIDETDDDDAMLKMNGLSVPMLFLLCPPHAPAGVSLSSL